jgi:hypothetical protein
MVFVVRLHHAMHIINAIANVKDEPQLFMAVLGL